MPCFRYNASYSFSFESFLLTDRVWFFFRNCFQTMCKKFKDDVKVWVEYGKHLFSEKKAPQARETLSKALKSLPSSQHVEIITQFALLEYKCVRTRGSFTSNLLLVDVS